jgi:hypothetical protein
MVMPIKVNPSMTRSLTRKLEKALAVTLHQNLTTSLNSKMFPFSLSNILCQVHIVGV